MELRQIAELKKYVQDMETNNDCGPSAVATITRIPKRDVIAKWPGGFRGNQSDSYIHHQGVLNRLGLRWETLSLEDILSRSDKLVPGNTAIMLNAKDDPETWIREDLIVLHWCVFGGYIKTHDGKDYGIVVFWLDGTTKSFSFDAIKTHFTNPFCVAYTVANAGYVEDLPWYKRLYKRVISWLPFRW